MAHTCPNQTPQHTSNSQCACTCVECLIGARRDLEAKMEEMGKAFDTKVKTLEKQYEQALADAIKKLAR